MPLGPKLREAATLRALGADADARLIMLGGFSAIVVALLTMFGPHGASAAALERRLARAVESALAGPAFIGVHVTMRGQVAVLDGVVASRAQARRAEELALRAVGRGGSWNGGVVAVVNRIASAGARLERPAAIVWGEDRLAALEKMKWSALGAGAKLALHCPSQRVRRTAHAADIGLAGAGFAPRGGCADCFT